MMTTTTSNTTKSQGRVILPSSNPTPRHYDLKFTPCFDSFTFQGNAIIHLDCNHDPDGTKDPEPCKSILLHAKELAIHSAKIVASTAADDQQRVTVECTEIRMNLKHTTCELIFEKEVLCNTMELHLQFQGILNDQMAGFYRSKYTDIHGNVQYMASTQFEALDARRAFPCFDEPALKATFTVTLDVPEKFTALSNMPVQTSSTYLDKGSKIVRKIVTFMKTPIMSTYLVAFVIGELDCVQGLTSNTKTLISVYTPPGQVHKGTFALDVAIKCLEFYNTYFDVPYPLPKLDMVAIPEFAAGAMENWGLVTYRTVDLLITPNQASQSQMQRVCVVVCHELAHQWFGNLCTMTWWDDLWLNEGFASFMENYAIYKLFDQFSYIWDEFSSTGALASALRLDALRTSHPIQVPIYHAEEVEQVFDAISYCKGACVVKMVSAVLGNNAFQSGLKLYMDTYKYKNTETYQLWDCWEKASNGIPIGELMKSWTEQCGFPLLKVVKEEWNADAEEVTLTMQQTWFLSDGSLDQDQKSESKKIWCIPILVLSDDGVLPSVTWMREEYCTVTIPVRNDGFVKLNANHDVPMRVHHTPAMLSRMQSSILSMKMPVTDRSGLLLDKYALLKAKLLNHPKELLQLLTYYRNESNPIVWEAIEAVLFSLEMITSQVGLDVNGYFRSFAKKIVMPLSNLVGWEPCEGESELHVLLRGSMLRLFSAFCYDDQNVIDEAKVRFLSFKNDPSDVKGFPSDIRLSIFKIILKNGGKEEYETIQNYFFTASDEAEKKLVLNSLGYTKDSSLKLRTLEWTLSGDIKLQDFFYPMGSVSRSSKEGLDISWSFLKEHLPKIQEKVGKASSSLMDAVIVSCCGLYCSYNMANEIEEFFKVNPMPKNERKISQTCENIRSNAGLLEDFKARRELADSLFWNSLLE